MATEKRVPRFSRPPVFPGLWVAALVLASCREPVSEPARKTAGPPARETVLEWPAGQLRSGGSPVAAELGAGEVHRYRLPLRQGDLLRLVVDQQGIDAVVSLDDPTGVPVLEADGLSGDRGPERVLAVTGRSGDYSLVVRGSERSGPGRYEAHIDLLRPASEDDRRCAGAYRLFTRGQSQEDEEKERLTRQALAVWRDLGETALEGEALYSLAFQHFNRQEMQPAAELFREAAATFTRAGDPFWEAIARTDLGTTLLNLDETQEAIDQYTRALRLAEGESDQKTRVQALHGLGQAHRREGELQQALTYYRQALELWPESDPRRPFTLHQLGVLYLHYLHDEKSGAHYLHQALKAWGRSSDQGKAATLSQLGKLTYRQGHLDKARRYFEQALALQSEDPCGSAVVLMRLALVEEAQGARRNAEARSAEARRTLGTRTCPKSRPTVSLLAGELAEKRDNATGARAAYQSCTTLFDGLGDRLGVAECLTGTARSARLLGDRQAARTANRRALDILQEVRPTVLSEDLRISFFSGARSAFDLQIDLLLELDDPEEAWATAEEARARVLQDLLVEAGASLRKGAAPHLVNQERALQRQLNVLQTRLSDQAEVRPEKLQSLRQALDAKVSELEALRGEIRRKSPRYAFLTRPEPDLLAATRDLLDDDTVLLEYRLGEARSTVWAVTRDAFTAFHLPPRRDIERVAGEATRQMTRLEQRGRANPPALCELSRKLLAPVASFLGTRRLVVVADGALEAISFAALPMPADDPSDPGACQTTLLVDDHEIVSLPSMATLLTQRRRLEDRRPAPKWLAVVADPVYRSSYRRLPASAQEADAIVAGRPRDMVFEARGAAASRQTVESGRLRDFRILHFAVHGMLDSKQPLLSALGLSELDPAGMPVQGALYAHEIYNLDLPAELVVLSACETALGSDVPGEGLVSGLPRAFLYAGAARVLVSLWKVEDQSTRDLMVHFYRGLFDRQLPPAKALQEAQRTLRRQGKPPRQWAGFVLLGDWRPLPSLSH